MKQGSSKDFQENIVQEKDKTVGEDCVLFQHLETDRVLFLFQWPFQLVHSYDSNIKREGSPCYQLS